MIELRRLLAFVAIAEESHITRAAERLGMQQPPLSRLLQGLEAELGVVLMHRLPRGVRPTEAGNALLAEARAILAQAQRLTDIVHRVARGEQGQLAVGFTSSAALHPFVPAALRRFREAWPGVAVTLMEAGTAELVEATEQERLDAAFIRAPVGRLVALRVDDVLDEAMLVALPSGHPLAATDAPLALADLAGEGFVLYRRAAGPGLYDAIMAACHAAGFSPVVAQEAPRLLATLSLVAAGLGVSIVPASMRRIGGVDIAYRTLSQCGTLSAPILLVTRRGTPAPVVRQFRAQVQGQRDENR